VFNFAFLFYFIFFWPAAKINMWKAAAAALNSVDVDVAAAADSAWKAATKSSA